MERQKLMRLLNAQSALEFTGIIEAINGNTEPNQPTEETFDGQGRERAQRTEQSRDQCVKLRCVLPETGKDFGGDEANSTPGLTHLIVAADNSGSMAGSPFKQVQEALGCIIGQCLSSQDVLAEVILYNHSASQLSMNTTNYKQVINTQKCDGCTNFTEAFKAIQKLAGSRGLAVTKTVVIFLTDGENTVESHLLNGATESFKKHLKQLNHESVVHTLGFSSSHDLEFLTDLTKGGKTDGVYQYCDRKDGQQALSAKLLDMFDFATIDSHEVEIQLTVKDGGKFVGDGGMEDTITVTGQIVTQQPETEYAEARETAADDWVIELSVWVYLEDPTSFPKIYGRMKLPSSTEQSIHFLPLSILSLQRRIVELVGEKVQWNVQVLARNISILSHRFSKAIHAKKDLTKYEDRLEKIQNKLSNVQVYGVAGIKKETRTKIFEEVASLRKTVDSLLTVLTEHKRGLGNSVSVLARASDLRYQGQFKRAQARKQRMMDKRARKNIDSAKSAQSKLDSIKVDVAQLKSLSEEARNFFFCVLSQTNVTEVLLDGDDRVDCLGFGLAIQRPEHVLDEPTAMRISVISGTLVSRSSMMDAWKHRIHIEGHMKAHGGFDFKHSLGVTTVGTSNEPINAWLPLYVCPTHWERVKLLLKPSLGYFCTLDSLGYDYKQMDVMFLVLGNMISQLRPDTVSEHQLRILFAFQRTCAAVMKDYELTEPIVELINNFIESTEGRTRDVVPNLLTLVGYFAALPLGKLLEIFGDNGKVNMGRLFMAITAETARRSASSIFKDYSDNTTLGLLFKLMFGNENKATETKCRMETRKSTSTETNNEEVSASKAQDKYSEFLALCIAGERATEELKSASFDPSSGITAPVMEMQHRVEWDKAMEVWAQAKLGIFTNKNRAKQVQQANKVVAKWKERCTDSLTSISVEQNPELEDGEDESWKTMDSSILQLMAKVLTKINANLFPSMSGLASCSVFLEFLVHDRIQVEAIDGSSGLAPQAWIAAVKEILHKTFRRFHDWGSDTDIQYENVSYEDDDDTDDDDDKVRRHAGRRRVPLECTDDQATLPEVLALFSGNLCTTAYEEVLVICRAMLCQALLYNSNSKARAAAKTGKLADFSQTGLDISYNSLKDVHQMFIDRQKSALQNELDRAVSEWSNFSMIRSTSPWAFAGYLMNAYQDRGTGLHDLVQDLTDPSMKSKIPVLEDKIRILVTGKLNGHAVLAKGNPWFPEKAMIARFQSAIGEETWMAIEIENRSLVAIHVYRESDLPNRHGHCNSNPFIPNWLRLKLGMAILQPKDLKKLKRCHTHLTQ